MNVEIGVRKRFRLICTKCGKTSPWANTHERAVKAAMKQNWNATLRKTLCPKCERKK